MWDKTASTVTIDDLKTYFKGVHWKINAITDNSLEANSYSYSVVMKAKGFSYFVKIEAVDDPADSDEKVTDEPIKFIASFLETGTSGDELLQKMSSDALLTAKAVRTLSYAIESGLCIKKSKNILRRMAVALEFPFVYRVFSAVVRTAARQEIEKEELDDLKKAIKAKGWNVYEEESDTGLPKLTVDVSDIYTAEITVESIEWHYTFEVIGKPETKEDGITDDPIEAFRTYYRKPEIQEAKETKKLETSKTTPSPGVGYVQTEKPESGPSPEPLEKTKRPGK